MSLFSAAHNVSWCFCVKRRKNAPYILVYLIMVIPQCGFILALSNVKMEKFSCS